MNKRKYFGLVAAFLFVGNVYAAEQASKTASLDGDKITCLKWAQEDKIPEDQMEAYMKACLADITAYPTEDSSTLEEEFPVESSGEVEPTDTILQD